MDAREKWSETAKKIATEYAMRFGGYVKYPSGKGFDLCEEKLNELDAHLRTTPEGFALVPDKPTCWMYTGKVTGAKSFSTVQHAKNSSPPEYFDETPLYAVPPPKSEHL